MSCSTWPRSAGATRSSRSDDDQFWLKDTGSRNGTIVNGQQVAGQAQLRDGDRIVICDVEFEFRHLPPTGILGGVAPAARRC